MRAHGCTQVTAERLEAIRKVYRPEMSQREIAEAMGVSKAIVSGLYLRYRAQLADCPSVAKTVTATRTKRPNKYFTWSPEKLAQVGEYMKAGLTGKQIGAKFGVSRDAIIALTRKDPSLAEIGLARSHKNRPVLNEEERRARRKMAVRRYKEKVKGRPATPRADRPHRQPFKPVVVSNNTSLMVQDWIAKNGVRRFEKNTRSDYHSVAQYLEERGYKLIQRATRYTLAGPRGRPRFVTWKEAIALVDKFRRSEGLQPFMAA